MLLLSLLLLEQCSALRPPDSVCSLVACGIQPEGKPLPFPREPAGIRAHEVLPFHHVSLEAGKY